MSCFRVETDRHAQPLRHLRILLDPISTSIYLRIGGVVFLFCIASPDWQLLALHDFRFPAMFNCNLLSLHLFVDF